MNRPSSYHRPLGLRDERRILYRKSTAFKIEGFINIISRVGNYIAYRLHIEKYVFIDTFEMQQSRDINVFNFKRLNNKSV